MARAVSLEAQEIFPPGLLTMDGHKSGLHFEDLAFVSLIRCSVLWYTNVRTPPSPVVRAPNVFLTSVCLERREERRGEGVMRRAVECDRGFSV